VVFGLQYLVWVEAGVAAPVIRKKFGFSIGSRKKTER
jgi:hypothetical protein